MSDQNVKACLLYTSEKTEKVDEPLYGTGTDRNGWSNDRIRCV